MLKSSNDTASGAPESSDAWRFISSIVAHNRLRTSASLLNDPSQQDYRLNNARNVGSISYALHDRPHTSNTFFSTVCNIESFGG